MTSELSTELLAVRILVPAPSSTRTVLISESLNPSAAVSVSEQTIISETELSLKAPACMYVTDSGKLILSKEQTPTNASLPIAVTGTSFPSILTVSGTTYSLPVVILNASYAVSITFLSSAVLSSRISYLAVLSNALISTHAPSGEIGITPNDDIVESVMATTDTAIVITVDGISQS